MLRRLLGHRVSVEAMIEIVMMPAGSEIAAYLTTAALWPWELLGAHIYVG